MLSDKSVEALNSKLEEKGSRLEVEQLRFRPNLYAEGVSEAFAEDKWRYIRIGEDGAAFRMVQLCQRCVFTTVDPETGEKDRDGEPLKTLRTFRSVLDPEELKVVGSAPCFGVNLAMQNPGRVRVGDKMYVGK